MSAVVGSVELGLVVALAAALGQQLQSRLLRAAGATAVLGAAILGLGSVIVTGELLGSVGLFRPVPLIVLLAVLNLALSQRRTGRGPTPDDDLPGRGAVAALAVGIASAPIALAWVRATWQAAKLGMHGVDSLGDHLPRAARFAQSGETFPLYVANPLVFLQWHPGNNELLAAAAMASVGSDAVVPVLNLGWLALLLLAGWTIARLPGLVGALLVGISPVLFSTSAGTAKNDLAVAALIAAAAAILLVDHRRPGPVAVAGVAAGLAMGTKITAIGIVALLTLAVLTTRPGSAGRLRRDAAWIAALGLTGGYWYIRNLWYAGSPLPTVPIGIGPVTLPTVDYEVVDHAGFAVLHYAGEGDFWLNAVGPSLEAAFSPAWFLVLALALGGSVLALLSPDQLERRLGLVAFGAHLVYLATPGTAFGPEGEYSVFYVTVGLRYATAGLVLGLVLFARRARWRHLTLVMMTVLVVVTGGAALDAEPGLGPDGVLGWSAAIIIALGIPVVVAVAGRHPKAMATLGLLGVVVGVLGLSLLPDGPRYHDGSDQEAVAAWRWAKTVSGATIVTAGRGTAYPLVGLDLDNTVIRAVTRSDGGDEIVITDCQQWAARLDELRATHVVTAPPGFGDSSEPVEAGWLAGVGWAEPVVDASPVRVFAITSPPDPQDCP